MQCDVRRAVRAPGYACAMLCTVLCMHLRVNRAVRAPGCSAPCYACTVLCCTGLCIHRAVLHQAVHTPVCAPSCACTMLFCTELCMDRAVLHHAVHAPCYTALSCACTMLQSSQLHVVCSAEHCGMRGDTAVLPLQLNGHHSAVSTWAKHLGLLGVMLAVLGLCCRVCTCVCVHTDVCESTCMCVHICACTWLCARVPMHAMCARMCTCLCTASLCFERSAISHAALGAGAARCTQTSS